jgi:hypothetical protein
LPVRTESRFERQNQAINHRRRGTTLLGFGTPKPRFYGFLKRPNAPSVEDGLEVALADYQ